MQPVALNIDFALTGNGLEPLHCLFIPISNWLYSCVDTSPMLKNSKLLSYLLICHKYNACVGGGRTHISRRTVHLVLQKNDGAAKHKLFWRDTATGLVLRFGLVRFDICTVNKVGNEQASSPRVLVPGSRPRNFVGSAANSKAPQLVPARTGRKAVVCQNVCCELCMLI